MKKDDIQNLALSRILPMRRCGLAMSVGSGKTLVGLRWLKHRLSRSSRFLIVVPKLSIVQVWKDEAEKFNLTDVIDRCEFTTYLSLHKASLQKDAVILEEAHSLLDTHEVFLSKYGNDILGLTGTAPKWENSEKGRMIAKYCPIVYEYIVDDAVEDGILNDYRIVVHKLPLEIKKIFKKETRSGNTWMTSERADYEYWTSQIEQASTAKKLQISRVMRMKAMMTYPSKVEYARKLFQSIEGKCILFCNTIEQASKMSPFSYTSKNPLSEHNLEMLKLGEIDKLSCVLQLNEGVNIPGLRSGIIMHSYGNERKSGQRIGRLLRLNPDDIAEMHILCYADSVDERWTKSALEDFDETKITWQEAGIKQLT